MGEGCLAIIPVRTEDVFAPGGGLLRIGNAPVLERTVAAARASRSITRVIISTDDPKIAKMAAGLGAEVPFLRPKELSRKGVGLPKVLHYTLERMEREGVAAPEIVVLLEVSHPFRSPRLIDQVVGALDAQRLDSVFTVVEVRDNFWQVDDAGQIRRVSEADATRDRSQKSPLYREILGLVCATRRRCLDGATLLGEAIGVVPVRTIADQVDLADAAGRVMARSISGTHAEAR